MSEEQRPLAANPIQRTERSKELTDKIHRLVRRFSRELVELVSQEIGARAIKVKNRPGPKVGHKARRGICPLCQVKENTRRKFGFICKDCSAGKDINRPEIKAKLKAIRKAKREARDKLGEGFKIEVPIPTHLPVQPKEVEVEDAEPNFLDTIVQIVEAPEKPPRERKKAESSEDFWL